MIDGLMYDQSNDVEKLQEVNYFSGKKSHNFIFDCLMIEDVLIPIYHIFINFECGFAKSEIL